MDISGIGMTDKILYLVEGLVDLGIAKSIQEHHDCEIYAIIDVSKHTKKFFQEQQLVKFHKIWYYRDYMINLEKKADVNYLANFEKKYNINLWMIAYSDRILTLHNNYYSFNHDEILAIFDKECKLFEEILDEVKPVVAIIKNPDYNQSQLLFELCKARGIKRLTLSSSRFGYRSIISEQVDIIDNYDKLIENYSSYPERTIEELQDYLKGYFSQARLVKNEIMASMFKKFKAAFRYLFIVNNNEYRKYYVNYGRTRLRVLKNEGRLFFKKLYRGNFLNKNFKRDINTTTPFVYYPLGFQPERTTLMDAPFYINQLELITNIAKSLPAGYKLYVKEHPAQHISGWRSISYYKTILKLPNIELIHPSIPSENLVKNCSLAIGITGTTGLEATFHFKPAIVLADTIYSNLPSVYRLKSMEELPQAIRSSLRKKVHLSDLIKYSNCIIDNSFEHDQPLLDVKISNRFNYGGFLFDIEIPVEEASAVIEENKSVFDKLATEYIKKINEHKKFAANVSK